MYELFHIYFRQSHHIDHNYVAKNGFTIFYNKRRLKGHKHQQIFVREAKSFSHLQIGREDKSNICSNPVTCCRASLNPKDIPGSDVTYTFGGKSLMQDKSGIAWLKYKDHRMVGLSLGAFPVE